VPSASEKLVMPINNHPVEVDSPPARAVPLPTRVTGLTLASNANGVFPDAGTAGNPSVQATEIAIMALVGIMAARCSVAELGR